MKNIYNMIILILATTILLSAQTWNHILPDYSIVDIASYDGGYWLATASSGALRYDIEENKWYRYNSSNGYMSQSDDVSDMKIIEGKVWFATNYGLYRCNLDGSSWVHNTVGSDYFSNWIRDMDYSQDTVWIASFTGLFTYSTASKIYTSHDIAVNGHDNSSYIYSLSATDSIVWIGTEDGLIAYDRSASIDAGSSRTFYGDESIFDGSDNVVCKAVCATEGGVFLGLEEYTTANNPDYCLGGLFGLDHGVWSKYDDNDGLSANGVHFIKNYGNKLYAGLFHYVNGVNFDGAGLLVFNINDNSLQVLNKDNWHIGTDAVRSFYCTPTDTLVGTEEGLFTNLGSMPGLPPYETPSWFSLRNVGNGKVEVRVDSVYRADAYELYCSHDGISFPDTLVINATCDTITTLSVDSCYYFKIAGKNDNGVAPACKDILGVRVSEMENDILLIQGFDLSTTGNTYDYCIDHGSAIANAGYGFDAVSDEALFTTDINLSSYTMIDWITGMDKNVFTSDEKNAIISYLEGGGKLFISGSQIIDNVYVVSRDAAFYADYLKAGWVSRDVPGYGAQPVGPGVFNGVGAVAFDDGSHGIYDVVSPDGFRPVGGAEACMLYSEQDSASFGSAALQYTGTFGSSSNEAQLVYMGFPFESVYSDSLKNALMACILNYFNYDVVLTANDPIDIPGSMSLDQNYPNPFNPITTIGYFIPEGALIAGQMPVKLSIYDIVGKRIATLVNEAQSAGYYTVSWNASPYSSGVYFYRLETDNFVDTKKMLLMK